MQLQSQVPKRNNMKNSDIAIAFHNGWKAQSNNMTCTGTKVYSYDTVIAEKIVTEAGLQYVINNTKYSPTTSKHLGYIKRYLVTNNIFYLVTTTSVPKNTNSLKDYI